MSTAEQSRVYRFRDDVALTLHLRYPDGLDIRTGYIKPAHALLLACDLIRAAIDCTEQPEERSACGTVERAANDCDNAADAMGEVVRLIDREAMGALVSGPEPMPNTRLSAAAYMHLETMEPGSERVLVRQAIRELGRGTGKGYAVIDGRYAEVAGTSRVLGFQQEGDSLHILCIINKGGTRR